MFKKKVLSVILGILSVVMFGGGVFVSNYQPRVASAETTNSGLTYDVSTPYTETKEASDTSYGLKYVVPEYYKYGTVSAYLTANNKSIENLTIAEYEKFYTDDGYAFPHYQISSVSDMVKLASLVNGGVAQKNDVFVLTKDLDFSNILWTPIGTGTNPFQSVFLGNDHTISNITINDASVDYSSSKINVGLFGAVSEGCIVEVNIGGDFIVKLSQERTNVRYGAVAGVVYYSVDYDRLGEVIETNVDLDTVYLGFSGEGETYTGIYDETSNKTGLKTIGGVGSGTYIELYDKNNGKDYYTPSSTLAKAHTTNTASRTDSGLYDINLYYTYGVINVSPRKGCFYEKYGKNQGVSWAEKNLYGYTNFQAYSYAKFDKTNVDDEENTKYLNRRLGNFYTTFYRKKYNEVDYNVLGLVTATYKKSSSVYNYCHNDISFTYCDYDFKLTYPDYDTRGTETLKISSDWSLNEYFKSKVDKSNLSYTTNAGVKEYMDKSGEIVYTNKISGEYYQDGSGNIIKYRQLGNFNKELYGPFGNYVALTDVNGGSVAPIDFIYTPTETTFDFTRNLELTKTEESDICEYTRSGSGTLSTTSSDSVNNWSSPNHVIGLGLPEDKEIKNVENVFDGNCYNIKISVDTASSKEIILEMKVKKDGIQYGDNEGVYFNSGRVLWDSILKVDKENKCINFYYAPTETSLTYYYEFTIKTTKGYRITESSNGYSNTAFQTEADVWLGRVLDVGTISKTPTNGYYSLSWTFDNHDYKSSEEPCIAWDNYYINTVGKNTRENTGIFDDSQEYTKTTIGIVEVTASVRIRYFDEYDLENQLSISSGKMNGAYFTLNGISFEDSTEKAGVPIHKAGEVSTDEISFTGNSWYENLKCYYISTEGFKNASDETGWKNYGDPYNDLINYSNDGNEYTTYITIILSRKTYKYDYIIPVYKYYPLLGGLYQIQGISGLISEEVTYTLPDETTKSTSESYPWGTTLSLTITPTENATKLFGIGGSEFSESYTTTYKFEKNEAETWKATFEKGNIYRYKGKISFDKYSLFSSVYDIEYLDKNVAEFYINLPVIGVSASIDASKLFSNGEINYANLTFELSNGFVASNVLLPAEYYFNGNIYLQDTTLILSDALDKFNSNSTILTEAKIKENLIQNGNISEDEKSLSLTLGVNMREITYKTTFSAKLENDKLDGGTLYIYNGGTKTWDTYNLKNIVESAIYTNDYSLPVMKWTGHTIKGFNVTYNSPLGTINKDTISEYTATETQSQNLFISSNYKTFLFNLTTAEDGKYAYISNNTSAGTVTLDVNWERKNYNIVIDGEIVTVQINDKIAIDYDNEKFNEKGYSYENQAIANCTRVVGYGQAQYNIYRPDENMEYSETPKTHQSDVIKFGYNVAGFMLADKIGSNSLRGFDFDLAWVIDEDDINNIEELFAKGYYANAETYFEHAIYKVYLKKDKNNYWTITRDGDKDNSTIGNLFKTSSLTGEDENGIFVYAYATSSDFKHESFKITIFENPTLDGIISVERFGYDFTGWSGDGYITKCEDGNTYLMLPSDMSEDGFYAFNSTTHYITPTFTQQGVTDKRLKVELEYKVDATANSGDNKIPEIEADSYVKVYALREKDIISISINGEWLDENDRNTSPSGEVTLLTGAKITNQIFKVEKYNSQTSSWDEVYNSGNKTSFDSIFNYNVPSARGEGYYRFTCIYLVEDEIAGSESYTIQNSLYYIVVKNKFISDNLETTYSPDGNIFGNMAGNCGTNYSSLGEGDALATISVEELFGGRDNIKDNVRLATGENFNVGKGKSILIKAGAIKNSSFSLENGENITDFLECVTLDGQTYIKLYAYGEAGIPDFSGLTINKAEFKFDFGTISAFERLDEGKFIIRQDISIMVGELNLKYYRLTLDNYDNTRDTYTVNDGYSIFSLANPEIYYNKEDITSNYDIKITSGTLKVISTENTSKLEVKTRGITIQEQVILNEGQSPTFISFDTTGMVKFSLVMNGSEINFNGQSYYQYSTEDEGVLFFVQMFDDGCEVYVNHMHSQAIGLRIDVKFTIKEEYKDLYKIVGISESEVDLTKSESLGVGVNENNYASTSQIFSSIKTEALKHPILSNVQKVKVQNYAPSTNKIAYLKVGGGELNIGTPQSGYTYAQLEFIGFEEEADSLDIQISEGAIISASKLSTMQTLTPKYKFVGYEVNYSQSLDGIYANPNDSIIINKTQIFGEGEGVWGENDVEVESFNLIRSDLPEGGQISLSSDDFYLSITKDGKTFASTLLSGTYTAEIVYKYNGDTITKSFEIELQVLPQQWKSNTISLSIPTTYDGDERNKNAIGFSYALSGSNVTEDSNLEEIVSLLRLDTVIRYKKSENDEEKEVNSVKNSGIYTFIFTPNVENIWEEGDKKISLTITPFEIKDINFSITKVMSSEDNLTTTYDVFSTGETLTLTFTRESGERVGYYKFTSVEIDDEHKDNYIISGNLGGLTIKEPSGSYNISLEEDFSITYDGTNINDNELSVIYDNTDNCFKISVSHNGQTSQAKVDLYYWDEDKKERVAVPTDTTFTLSFETSGKDVGDYKISIKIGEKEVSDDDSLYLNITAKKVDVTSIEKTFDGNTSLVGAKIVFDGFIEGESATLSGEFSSAMVGTYENMNLSLSGNDNYVLSEKPITGKITPTNVSEITSNITTSGVCYGDITENLLKDNVLEKVNIDFNINGIENVVASGFVEISSITLTNDNFSSSRLVKAGENTFEITLTSDNFEGLEKQTFTITIAKKEIDLSGLVIEKNYDGDYSAVDKRPSEVIPNLPSIDEYLIDGDKVEISSNTKFDITESFVVGTISFKDFSLEGDDSDNYVVTHLPTGEIKTFTATIILTQEETVFVDDGKNVSMSSDKLEYSYPFNSASDVYNELISCLPTRIGYKATWYYEDMQTPVNNNDGFAKKLVEIATSNSMSGSLIARWTINTFDVTISYQVGIATVTYSQSVEYYSDLEISVQAKEGYKLLEIVENETYYDTNSSSPLNTGNRTSQGTYKKITGKFDIQLNFAEIQVTFDLKPSIPSPNGTTIARTDNEKTKLDFNYSTLSELYISNLSKFTLTEGTYIHTDFQYLDLSENTCLVGNKTLQSVVKDMATQVEGDITLSLNAIWEGVDYVISFSLNNNGEETIPQEIDDMELKFGDVIESLPSATMKGKKIKTWRFGEKDITSGKEFDCIGTKNGNKFEVTLDAIWEGEEFTLTIYIGNHVTKISYNGEDIVDGQTFNLKYQETSLKLTVSVEEGYTPSYEAFSGVIEKDVNTIGGFTISNISEDCSITFIGEPNDNPLTISGEHLGNIKVETEGGDEIPQTDEKFIVKTGERAIITITSEKGYAFGEDSTPVLNGSGSVSVDSYTENQIILIWSGFTNGASIKIDASPRNNQITFASNNAFDSISLDGGITYSSLSQDVIGNIQTGQDKEIIVKLKYGYKNPILEEEDFIKHKTISWNDSDKVYVLTLTIHNVEEDTTFNLDCEKREYTFKLAINSGMEAFATIISSKDQTLGFGEEIALGVSINYNGYGLAGWQMYGKTFSTSTQTNVLISEDLKAYLEGGEHDEDGVIIITAVIRELVTPITFKTNGMGRISFEYSDFEDDMQTKTFNLAENKSEEKKLKIGEEISITITPNEGYNFDYFKINGSRIDGENSYNAIYSNGVLTLTITADIENIEFVFVANEFTIEFKAVVRVYYQNSQPTNEGGEIYICDKNGNKLDEYEEGSKIGYHFFTQTFTNDQIYLLVQPKTGFEPLVETENCTSQRIASGEKIIYDISSIKEGGKVTCIFSAKTNTIQVKYALSGGIESVNAGRFEADTTSTLIYSINNNSYAISMACLTNSTLNVKGYLNGNYTLVTNEGKIVGKVVYASGKEDENLTIGDIIDSDYSVTGFMANFDISLTNINEDATIYIYVQPKVYNLRLFVDEENSIYIERGITFGKNISFTSLLSEEQLKIAFKQKDGFDHGGYYTMQLGQGIKYITDQGVTLRAWSESGYKYNGLKYIPVSNFDEDSQTFTLFVYWMYKKAYITFDLTPDKLIKNEFASFRVSDFVSGGFSDASGWIGDDNNFYMETMAGKKLTFTAISVNGYVFERWIVSYNNETEEFNSNSFTFTFENLRYRVVGIYRPTYTLTTYCSNNKTDEGGSALIMQDGLELNGSFSSEKELTLIAWADEGYKFLYFENLKTGEKMYGELKGDKYYYTLSKQNSSLSLRAVFKGEDVNLTLDLKEIALRHILQDKGVLVNGTRFTLTDGKLITSVNIGDEIVINIKKSVGFKIIEEGDVFTLTTKLSQYGRDDLYTYTYKVKYADLTKSGATLSLSEKFTAPKESINFTIVNGVEVDGRYIPSSGGGKVTMFIEGREEEKIIDTRQYELLFGTKITLDNSAFENYKLAYFIVNGERTDLSSYMQGKNLIINENFMETFYSNRKITLEICFKAMIWSDEDSRSTFLKGSGIKDDAYLVSSASDFGFIVYAINNDLSNENGLKYKDAYYKVVCDINFEGKFWSPIGEENAFNGTFDLGSYNFSNIILDKSYTNPATSYRGLFLNLTKDAKIIQSKAGTMLIIGILAGTVGGILCIILLAWLIRRRKKNSFNNKVNNF